MTDEQHVPADAEAPVIRDRRRIDPDTGLRREPDQENASAESSDVPTASAAAAAGPGSAGSDSGSAGPDVAASAAAATGPAGSVHDDALAQARAEAAERLDDLKRLQAEYVNYRRRVDRDREAVREAVKVDVLAGFLGVLDDIGRAREHGDLTGAFRAVGEAFEAAVAKAGLEQFGEVGDEFDPTIHEALMHGYSDDVEVTTCTQVLQPGYRVGDRIVRPARVAVADPTEALAEPEAGVVPDAAEPVVVEPEVAQAQTPGPETAESVTAESEAVDAASDENGGDAGPEPEDGTDRSGDEER